MPTNYYDVLGVPSSASIQQIKSAYRKRVKELHPDRSGTDSGPFLAVQRAYSVLIDPVQRRGYDRELAEAGERQRVRRAEGARRKSPWAEPLRPEPMRREPVRQRRQPGSSLDPFGQIFDELWDELTGSRGFGRSRMRRRRGGW